MDVEEIVAAAEAAIAAAEEAILAAEEAASGEGVADIAERVKALRGKRATEEDTTTATDEANTDGERAEGDESTDEEKKEVEAVRSIAKSYGLSKLVDDLSGLRAKPAEIRSAVRDAVMKRGLSSTPEAPAAVQPAKRSATPTEQLPSARSIYANLNGRKA